MTAGQPEFRYSHVVAGQSSLHVVEAGDPSAAPFLFLHGWPQSWRSWRLVMALAAEQVRAIAIDLPGIGGSVGGPADGSKQQLARTVQQLVEKLGLEGLTLVGQDVGGMVTYSYLRMFPGLDRAVIMDVVIPGVDPWDQVLQNPYLWHFAFHAIPRLPEQLTQGRQQDYFDYFYDILSPDPDTISQEARAAYVQAYSSDGALTTGFNWYRTLSLDAEVNRALAGGQLLTPVLYLRGEREGGELADYVRGFLSVGLVQVDSALVPEAGHFAQEDAPEETWRLISDFAGL
jgi:pimeloyl-ACP methyl ester carboxylesterase